MLIQEKDKYISSLISLWHSVFGDETDYIKLFFKEAYFDSECFAEIIEDEPVSALYLLKCIIKCDGKIYRGRYLYAAATLPEYRGKGLMSKLMTVSAEEQESILMEITTLNKIRARLNNELGRV
jgi:GNAT superfamily N-acetyltransferase